MDEYLDLIDKEGNLTGKIEAVVFDVDGLMFDTERLWLESVIETNKKYHINIPEETVIKCMGMRTNEIYKILSSYAQDKFTIDEIKKLHHNYKEEKIKKYGMPEKEGLKELLDFLKSENIKIGMATSSSLDKIKFYFKHSKISINLFDAIITGDMVKESKPNPEIYLKACNELHVNPQKTIALEDSEYGIFSAYFAGMKPILIPDLKKPNEEILKIIYKKCSNLKEVIDIIKNVN